MLLLLLRRQPMVLVLMVLLLRWLVVVMLMQQPRRWWHCRLVPLHALKLHIRTSVVVLVVVVRRQLQAWQLLMHRWVGATGMFLGIDSPPQGMPGAEVAVHSQ